MEGKLNVDLDLPISAHKTIFLLVSLKNSPTRTNSVLKYITSQQNAHVSSTTLIMRNSVVTLYIFEML